MSASVELPKVDFTLAQLERIARPMKRRKGVKRLLPIKSRRRMRK